MNVRPCHSNLMRAAIPLASFASPEGPLSQDCETFDEALDLAASNDELYLWIYVYNDNGEILHEAGCYREQLKKIHELEEQRPGRAPDERPKT
jgi:hypothetical protein